MSFIRTDLRWWAAGFAFWTLLAVLSIAQFAIAAPTFNSPVDWPRVVSLRFADWYTCAIFTPLFFWATQRWPIARPHLLTRAGLHVGIILGAVVIKYSLYAPIFRRVVASDTPTLSDLLRRSVISEFIAFGSMAAAIHAIEYYKRFREGERLALQLQARLSDAQLRALRAQLNPHFLFNTLNAATMLLHQNPHAADTMLTRLGELLRLTLRADPDHEATVREELELLQRYLDVMRVRFPDRLTIKCTVQPEVNEALVPSFILQPLVENAFEHGVARLQRPGVIDVSARASGVDVVLAVRDNGDGANGNGTGGNGASSNGHGLGLENTRRRLTELYGSGGSLLLSHPTEGGTLVEIRLPFHLAPDMSS